MKRAVLIDALGTMLWLLPPWEHADPDAFAGIAPERVQAGFIAEMTYYMARTDEGGDPEALADAAAPLRRACSPPGSAARSGSQTMMDAIRFEPYPGCAAGAAALRRGAE